MKRPFAVIGFSCLAALLTAFAAGVENAVLLCIIAVVMGLLSLLSVSLRKDRTVMTVCFSAAAALMLLHGYQTVYVAPCDTLYGKEVTVTGKLCDLPYKQYDRYYYRLSLDAAEPYHHVNDTDIVISTRYPQNVDLYETVTARVHINDKGSGTLRYHQLAQGIECRGYLLSGEVFTVSGRTEKPLKYYVLRVKRYLCYIAEKNLSSQDAALVKAVLLGDKTAMTPEEKTLFTKAGVSDLLCVSGLHLSVITGLMMMLLTLLTRKRKGLAAGICILFVFVYMAIVGFTPSVTRAGVMQILLLISQVIMQKTEPVNSLGLASLLICLHNPYAAVDISFLLSFSATLGILHIGNKLSAAVKERLHPIKMNRRHRLSSIYKLLRKAVDGLTDMISVSVAAIIFTAPVLIIYFKSLAVYGLLFHLLVGYAVVILLMISPLFLILGAIGGGIAVYPLRQLIVLLAAYIRNTAGLTACLPSPVIYLSEEIVPICLILSGAAVIVFFLTIRRRSAAAWLSVITAAAVFAAGGITDSMAKSESVRVAVLDTGEGLSVILSDSGDTAVLFCGGSTARSAVLDDYLELSSTESISLMLLIDKKNSCSNYAEELLRDYPVGSLQVYNPDSFNDRVQERFDSVKNMIPTGQDTMGHVFWHHTEVAAFKSGYGGAVRLVIHGKSFLAAADKTDCSLLPEEWRKTDYLIVNGELKNNSLMQAETVIIADTAEKIAADLKYDYLPESRMYFTAGEGNLAVRVYPEGDCTIRREKDWQS